MTGQDRTAPAAHGQQAVIAPAGSPERWRPENVRLRLADRLTPSEAMRLVVIMLDSFPAGSAKEADPDGYEPALAAVLCSHPREVAEDCADPRVGVVKQCIMRHALTPGRVNEWCEKHSAVLIDSVRREDERIAAAKKTQDLVGCDDKLSLEERRAVVAKFRERLGPDFGLKRMDAVEAARAKARGMTAEEAEQARIDEDRMRKEAREARERSYNERTILAEYAAKGINPVKDKGGRLLPMSFVAAVNPALLVRRKHQHSEAAE